MQTLQIARPSSPPYPHLPLSKYRTSIDTQKHTQIRAPRSRMHTHKTAAGLTCVSQCSFKLCGDGFNSCEWVWTVKLWHSCHRGTFNCYYWTDSSGSQGVEVVEKTSAFSFQTEQLGPTHPLCEAAVPVGAVWQRVATRWDLLQWVIDVFCLSMGGFKKLNNIKQSSLCSENGKMKTLLLFFHLHKLHKQVHATSSLFLRLLTDYREW